MVHEVYLTSREMMIVVDCLKSMTKHSLQEGYSEAEHCELEEVLKHFEDYGPVWKEGF